MKVDNDSLLLYSVTDRSWLAGKSLSEQVEEAIKAGVSFVQLREKDISFNDFLKLAQEIKIITDRHKVPFVINDDIEVALAVDADGVHVGQGDIATKEARRRIGRDKILGVSVQNVDQALSAQTNGADYLGVGAVFPTSTKLDADIVSYEMLKNISSAVSIPVVAIGGITKDNIYKLKGTGIKGVAVVSAIFAQPDIQKAAGEMLELSRELVTKK